MREANAPGTGAFRRASIWRRTDQGVSRARGVPDVATLMDVLEAQVRKAARGGTCPPPGSGTSASAADREAVPDMTTLEQAGGVIRPFTVQIPKDALDDLQRRLAA